MLTSGSQCVIQFHFLERTCPANGKINSTSFLFSNYSVKLKLLDLLTAGNSIDKKNYRKKFAITSAA